MNAVLCLLTDIRNEQAILAFGDLARELESADAADVAVRTLRRAGLIHVISNGFVFATRTGVRVGQMIDHVS